MARLAVRRLHDRDRLFGAAVADVDLPAKPSRSGYEFRDLRITPTAERAAHHSS
jgi:hypothetical protein